MINRVSKKEAFSTIHDMVFALYGIHILQEQSDIIYNNLETESDFSYDTCEREKVQVFVEANF